MDEIDRCREAVRYQVEYYDLIEKPLAGVEYSLIDEKDTCIMTARTDKNGIAVFEKAPFGKNI